MKYLLIPVDEETGYPEGWEQPFEKAKDYYIRIAELKGGSKEIFKAGADSILSYGIVIDWDEKTLIGLPVEPEEKMREPFNVRSKWITYSIEDKVVETFKQYGGWWRLEGMAEWLNVPVDNLRVVWERLEKQGILETQGIKKW
ncbi:hypothetical protein ES703_119045 [subsurface metagenome]